MKFQDDISMPHTHTRTSRNQYVPHFFKVGGIKSEMYRFANVLNEKKIQLIFSSPEAKAHKVCLQFYTPGEPASVSVSVSLCVNTFKHEYLFNLTEALLRWGKGCIKFYARSDQSSGFHGNR